jgi:hypothetical protein
MSASKRPNIRNGYCELGQIRSSHRRGAEALARGLRLLYVAQPTLTQPKAARLNDRQLPGALNIITAILEAPVIEKILTRLGLQARAPPGAAARGQALQAA